MTPSILADALAHARGTSPRESAGLVIEVAGKAIYRPCRNTSPDSTLATPDPQDMAEAEDAGRMLGFIHSHPDGNITPSPTDRASCERMGLPWWIVEPRGSWARIDPVSRPLVGRQFSFGVDDCWALCRDYYAREEGWALPDFTREEGFWEIGFEPHLYHLASAGFEIVDRGGLRAGDGLLFRVLAPTITHCGVYLGEGRFWHHLEGRLASRESLSPAWMNRLACVVRRCA